MHLECARELDPDSPDVASALNRVQPRALAAVEITSQVQALAAENRMEEVLNLTRSALERFPCDVRLTYYAALACVNLEQKDQALQLLDSAPLDKFGDAPAMLKAALLREMGQEAQALIAAQHAASINPANSDALLLRSALLESLGRVDEAEQSLCEALQRAGQRGAVELAAFYLRSGRIADAKRIANQALVL